jgi:hypothetical protein
MTSRAIVVIALALATILAAEACLRIVDLTPPPHTFMDAGSNATFEDGHPGSDGEGSDGGGIVHDAGLDDDGGLDAGLALDA